MKPLTDAYYQELDDNLRALKEALAVHLRLAPDGDQGDVMKLVAGVSVVLRLAGETPDIAQVNTVLFRRLGNGHTWFACLQFLSGVRARETFAKRERLLRELMVPEFVEMARLLLPDMPTVVADMLKTTPGGRAAEAVRDAKANPHAGGDRRN